MQPLTVIMKTKPCIFKAKFEDSSPVPLAEYLKTAADLSGRSLRKYFFKGLVFINRRKAHSEVMVKPGDLVQVYGFEEYTEVLTPEALPIEIVYEDAQLLAINKPALLPVHPSGKIVSGTLANRVAYYFQQREQKIKVRPVNRLDHGTSGLILFAKSAPVQERLSRAIQERRISRVYYAVVQGHPPSEAGLINAAIVNANGVRRVSASGQPAETYFRVIETFPRATLLELTLKTGRTHQIRVHLRHLDCPILGDRQYGVPSPLINRPALHAGKLGFDAREFAVPPLSVPLPEDMQALIAKLKMAIDC
jgi:23S rRNA pseudouridine1911/1915/1917 synthase